MMGWGGGVRMKVLMTTIWKLRMVGWNRGLGGEVRIRGLEFGVGMVELSKVGLA